MQCHVAERVLTSHKLHIQHVMIACCPVCACSQSCSHHRMQCKLHRQLPLLGVLIHDSQMTLQVHQSSQRPSLLMSMFHCLRTSAGSYTALVRCSWARPTWDLSGILLCMSTVPCSRISTMIPNVGKPLRRRPQLGSFPNQPMCLSVWTA